MAWHGMALAPKTQLDTTLPWCWAYEYYSTENGTSSIIPSVSVASTSAYCDAIIKSIFRWADEYQTNISNSRGFRATFNHHQCFWLPWQSKERERCTVYGIQLTLAHSCWTKQWVWLSARTEGTNERRRHNTLLHNNHTYTLFFCLWFVQLIVVSLYKQNIKHLMGITNP